MKKEKKGKVSAANIIVTFKRERERE